MGPKNRFFLGSFCQTLFPDLVITAMDPSSPPEQETGNCTNDTGSVPTVTEEIRLRRFLCYGSESAIYRAREQRNPCLERVSSLTELLDAGRGSEAVQEVRNMSMKGGVKSSCPALFVLAVISQHSDMEAKRAAYSVLKEVCTSPCELFSFVQYKKELSGTGQRGMWGRALRKAVADWYNRHDALMLAHKVTTCKRKGGWSHQDLFRLAHLKPGNEAVALVSKYLTKGWKVVQETYADRENSEDVMKVFVYLEAVEKTRNSSDELEVAHLIEKHKLEREHVLTKHLESREVWKALLKEMSISMLLTHLGKMSADKLLRSGSAETAAACERIQDEHALLKAKTHPLSILLAAENYKRGRDRRGKLKWKPDRDVIQALDSAFCRCLSNIESTGKHFVVGVDVSSRLGSVALGSFVSTVTLAAAMSMVITRSESSADVLLFSEGSVVPCTVSDDSSLLQITMQLVQACSSCTDCSLPITWASENGKTVDVFVIFTNNETWPGRSNPAQALRTYRQKTGVFAKLVVCGMTTHGLNVVDPDDGGMLEVCGFDSHTADIIRHFVLGVI
ncbi:60 kDa SS-A/Ro ribonucleoprotein isoform X1 [Tachysurus fulvidraco]|uniref:60 kDa SS-A/Ro ribonucleoprotein isoform X1 n=1 Tax=Tachysurus fulvidraco TaxID=1234273 RepID=UPI001FED6DAB|nr:60 kDa SS-A/Ro ribonucleoprotein isoform X1 [Tachysurus fulvidraco]